MDYQRPRIEYYRQRTFSEKMNVTFDFIRENWKPLLKYTFYLIMPVCLVQTLVTNSILTTYLGFIASNSKGSVSLGESLSSNMYSFMFNYGIALFCNLIGSAILSGLVYAMMQTYVTRNNGLHGVLIDDFKENLIRNAWRCIGISFFLIFLLVIVVCFAAFLAVTVSMVSLVLSIPLFLLFVLCLIPMMLVVPVYLFERDITFFGAFVKAWKLGTRTLGGLLGLAIVLGIISNVLQTVVSIPWYIVVFARSIFELAQESAANPSLTYKVAVYLLGLAQTYGVYIASILTIIGLAFQYFHAREKVEGLTIESNIENFSQL